MNKFCFGVIYNGRLWEKELRVSALVDTGYPHDGRADKDSYPHDRHNQYIMLSLKLRLSFSIDNLAHIYLIDHTSF